ncbi:response regulator [Candidatus Nomurabacteria bacterium CG10_big_fil_rev_8_21_14_0_10_35_16]|uniref:Response regulator n=1 Tax=Candidatus Nomurabacteria bacterium CG10_big_fil_rev_8_21_14_0_10_35_16 TaxID=1974731 RepID=A0A2H0TBG5_9BACT|nr:MAG: response regulator [Candidatus Nomurabacteria bacterium CG10_big_fil_rev_8_21_14_0_10_35_16]
MPKILLVEDESMLLEMYRMAFTGGSFQLELVIALNGKEALEKAKSEKPDLILLDILLPDMNGVDVLEQLKDGVDTKNIPIFVLTNFDTEGLAEKVKSMGAEKYLIKSKLTPLKLVEEVKQKFK